MNNQSLCHLYVTFNDLYWTNMNTYDWFKLPIIEVFYMLSYIFLAITNVIERTIILKLIDFKSLFVNSWPSMTFNINVGIHLMHIIKCTSLRPSIWYIAWLQLEELHKLKDKLYTVLFDLKWPLNQISIEIPFLKTVHCSSPIDKNPLLKYDH